MVIKYGVDFEKIIQIFCRQIHNNRFIPFLCYQDPSSLCHYFFKAQEKENGNHFKCSKNHNLESFLFFFFWLRACLLLTFSLLGLFLTFKLHINKVSLPFRTFEHKFYIILRCLSTIMLFFYYLPFLFKFFTNRHYILP